MDRNLNTTGIPVHAGDRRRIWATFQDASGVGTDPDAFTLAIREAGALVTTKTLADCTRDSQGRYFYDHLFSQPGRCKITLTATGNIAEVEPGYLIVEAA